jgi:hypothetical protein
MFCLAAASLLGEHFGLDQCYYFCGHLESKHNSSACYIDVPASLVVAAVMIAWNSQASCQ